MALYNMNPNPSTKLGTNDEYMRTQTNLIKDNGDAPSGKRMIDPRLPKKFKFHFGGQSGWVVLPKGRIVSIDPGTNRKAFDDGMYYNMITLANGGVDVSEANDDPADEATTYTRVANVPVGVSNLNVYQDLDDQFAGNVPGFVTRNTINLPYFTLKGDAEKTEWGSAYGTLKPGDWVKSDANGRFVKWEEHKSREQIFTGDGTAVEFTVDYAIFPEATVVALVDGSEVTIDNISYASGKVTLAAAPDDGAEVKIEYKSVIGDSIKQRVGQITQVDENLVPAGWLKWVMPEGEYVNPTGFRAQDLTDEGYPYDPQYMEGFADKSLRATGIPGLTDGSNIKVPYAGKPLGTIPENMDAGENFNFRVLQEDTPIVPGTVVVYFDDGTNGPVDVTDDVVRHIDNEVGLIMIELDETYATDSNTSYEVTVDFQATHQLPGMPSNIDFDGVAGSVDILLQL